MTLFAERGEAWVRGWIRKVELNILLAHFPGKSLIRGNTILRLEPYITNTYFSVPRWQTSRKVL